MVENVEAVVVILLVMVEVVNVSINPVKLVVVELV
jgi:hypothetical protein